MCQSSAVIIAFLPRDLSLRWFKDSTPIPFWDHCLIATVSDQESELIKCGAIGILDTPASSHRTTNYASGDRIDQTERKRAT